MSEPIQPDSGTICGSCDQHVSIRRLAQELANIHRVHIDDIRALLAQFETEKAAWSEKLQQAVGRECGALCGDIEQDRDDLTKEVQRLREEGVPGVMHQIDRMRLQVVEGDRDRFANLHANLVRRNRNLIGEFRAARHASRNVRLIEGLLVDALGREPGSINCDNIEDAFTELVRERDSLRGQVKSYQDEASEGQYVAEALRGRISLAVGTDVPLARMVEMFDHLVETYRGQATEIEILEAQCRDKTAEIRILEDADSLHSVALAAGVAAAEARSKRLAVGSEALMGRITELEQLVERQDAHAGAREDGPLPEFTIRATSDGQYLGVTVVHDIPGCDHEVPYRGGAIPLWAVVRDAHHHGLAAHPILSDAPDEAPPGDEENPCEDICYPSEGACCGGKRNVPTEVNK